MSKKALSMIAVFVVLPVCIWAALLLFSIPRSAMDTTHIMPNDVLIMPEMQRVFFAHMSVGYDILEGAETIAKRAGMNTFQIVETTNFSEMDKPGIYHARLEHNGDPAAKMEVFRKLMAGLEPALPDAAVMKFCYADFTESTEPDQLFESYRQMIDELEAKYPTVRFLHCTAPLTSGPLTFGKQAKEAVKAVLGKTVTADRNLKRHRFNERLRAAYPTQRIFDIALLESTSPEGHACYTPYQGQKAPTMLTVYTTDGGHLNERGKYRLGEHFLAFAAAGGREE